MFDWAQTLSTDMNFEFTTIAEHETKGDKLKDRFQNLKTIKGTRSYQAFISHDSYTIHCKKYSNSENDKVEQVKESC